MLNTAERVRLHEKKLTSRTKPGVSVVKCKNSNRSGEKFSQIKMFYLRLKKIQTYITGKHKI